MNKIITIVGARPQFIKLGPFSRAISKDFNEIIIHTGQHYDKEMSDLLFYDLEIPKPHYNLNIGSMQQGAQTARMIEEIEKIVLNVKPDLVVVFGDTNSTLAGALATVKHGIASLHIEAGLRSFNRTMPEEINRVVSDHTCDYLFAPTQTAITNLKNEGLENRSFLSGDIMVDSLKFCMEKAINLSVIEKQLNINDDFYLLTLHRPYNVDNPTNLGSIISSLSNLSKTIVFPIHPRTNKIIKDNNIEIPNNIKIIPPQGYLDFIKLQYLSQKIITDSGGIQKEAYLMQRPCITLRPETEWVETVENGWNILLDHNDNDFETIIQNFSPKHEPKPVFGEDVSEKMLRIIKGFLEGERERS